MSAPSKTEWLEKVLKAKAKAQDSLLQGSVAIFEGSVAGLDDTTVYNTE